MRRAPCPGEKILSRAARQPEAIQQGGFRRAFWIRQVRRWHWISSALCLSAMLLFAATGLTLNHADALEPQARTTSLALQLPPAQLASLASGPEEGAAPLPAPAAAWIAERTGLDLSRLAAEWSEEEVAVSAPRPGGQRSVAIDRISGAVVYETSTRGAVGVLNDLHTGRNSGRAWSLFIDVFAAGCLVFATTGLVLAGLYAPGRPVVWPLLAAGAGAPLVLVLLLLLHIL